jgi:hypothetical protein
MVLGLEPFEFRGEPVRGLYYYFHTYFPGFNGIRKVSRQAVMTTFAFSVLAGFGSAWLLGRLSNRSLRILVAASLLVVTGWELRCFPHPLQAVWSGDSLPAAYRFVATLPKHDIVASLPQNEGVRVFRGDAGLALHNYLMVTHRHRSVNGQGSWQPTATELADRALGRLPEANARRVLQMLGVRHLLVHGHDLPAHRRDLLERLVADERSYQAVFREAGDGVFTLMSPDDPTLALLDVPALPGTARTIPRSELLAGSNVEGANAALMIDGDPETAWSGRRAQFRGQTIEIALTEPRSVVALEIRNPRNLTHVPLSFEISVSTGSGNWRRVVEQPELRLFRELVHSPRNFVWRVVLPQPTVADHVRVMIRQPLPGLPLTIHELSLYADEG